MKQLTFSCCIAMAMLLGSGDQTYAKSERFPDHQWDEINIQARPGREAVQLELLQKFSNIEAILNYGEDTLYRQLSRSVGRLKVDIAGTYFLSCSATLISHNKILTSAHCVPGREQYGKVLKAKLEMGYIDPGDTSQVQTYQVNPIPLAWDFWNDIAILQVEGDPGEKWGSVELAVRVPKDDEKLFLIHHPAGKSQKITLNECKAVGILDVNISTSRTEIVPVRDIRNTCQSIQGSSGGPLFSLEGKLVGVAKSADKTFTKHLASSALMVGFMEKEAPDRGNLTLDTMWDEVLSYARQERAFQDFLKKREIELEEERHILEEIKTLPCTDARDLVEFEGLDLEISCTLPTRAEADIPKELEIARE